MVLGWSRKLVVAVTVVAAAAVGACGGSSPSQDFGKQDVEQIRQVVADFVAAYNAKDINKLTSHFSGNASVLPPNRSTLRGVELVRGYYEGRLNDDGATDLTFEPMAIEGQGNLGFVVGTYTVNTRPTDGPEGRDRGKIVWVVRKFGGQWRFEWQIMSSDLPPPAPPAPAPTPAAAPKNPKK